VSVLVVGAGPAGLAAAACLARRGVRAKIVESGDGPGTSWRRFYDRMRLNTLRDDSGLPGLPMPRSAPRYPTRDDYVAYLQSYAAHFELCIEPRQHAVRIERRGTEWVVAMAGGAEHVARVVVCATGIFSSPYRPPFADLDRFTGRTLHAAEYRSGASFRGQRVLVVGMGNSGAEIAVHLAEHGASPILATRAGRSVLPRDHFGVGIQTWARIAFRAGPIASGVLGPPLFVGPTWRQLRAGIPWRGALSSQPVLGDEIVDNVRRGSVLIRGGVERFTRRGAFLAGSRGELSFDAVVFATGYRRALGWLDGVVPLSPAGAIAREDVVQVKGVAALYVVGHTNDQRGTLFTIGPEAELMARHVTGLSVR
jgi:cation diffusion facilitator CzcD-associated flavoprotein CzcO